MPKPGKYNNWRQYNNGDNFRSERKVSFKQNKKHGDRQKDWSESIRAHLEDEDIDMNPSASFRMYKDNQRVVRRRLGSPAPVGNRNGRRKLLKGLTGWYRVVIPFGNKYEKEYLQQLLLERLAPIPFLPLMWRPEGKNVVFYLDDYKSADKLYNINREIQLPSGFRLMLYVSNDSPNVLYTDEVKEKIKAAFATRYNPQTKALDLTRFHRDPLFDTSCVALYKQNMLIRVVDLIAETIPDLEALNLSSNNIHMFSHMTLFVEKLPNVKILYMGSNEIINIGQFDSLNGNSIIELVLDGNPLCDKFEQKDEYISEVRKRFPKVIKLDGLDLPPPISFDIEEVEMPKGKQTFLCNAEGQSIVRQFLEQYFLLMDGDNRQPLLQAYHENAMFSMTMAYGYGQTPKNSPYLSWYNTENRNITRVTDSARRFKLLKQGHLQVVAFLNEMPGTKHDIHSFTVDMTLFTPQMLLVVVSGVYKEIKANTKVIPIRHFFRTFVIVPSGSGFCIANDELHITNATDAQIKEAFKTPVINAAPSTSTTPVAAPINVPDAETKKQMILAMCRESGMNEEWSNKCLEDTEWNYQKAAYVFTEAKNQGMIPAEAFVS